MNKEKIKQMAKVARATGGDWSNSEPWKHAIANLCDALLEEKDEFKCKICSKDPTQVMVWCERCRHTTTFTHKDKEKTIESKITNTCSDCELARKSGYPYCNDHTTGSQGIIQDLNRGDKSSHGYATLNHDLIDDLILFFKQWEKFKIVGSKETYQKVIYFLHLLEAANSKPKPTPTPSNGNLIRKYTSVADGGKVADSADDN